MQLSYLIPDRHYEFFREILPLLADAGLNVQVNAIGKDTDLILSGILPATAEWAPKIVDSGKPFVLWHWDYYSSTDYDQYRWQVFLQLLPDATEIWSCSYETCRQLKEVFGLDSYMMPAWIDARNFPKEFANDAYVLYAASGCGFGKRIDWAERACSLLKLPLKVLRNQRLPRQEYFRVLANCGLYLMTAFEESNGSIPAMEAAAIGKAIVLADIPSNREVFGKVDGVYYYDNWDFSDLLCALRRAWVSSTDRKDDLRERMNTLYDVKKISKRMLTRLKELGNA